MLFFSKMFRKEALAGTTSIIFKLSSISYCNTVSFVTFSFLQKPKAVLTLSLLFKKHYTHLIKKFVDKFLPAGTLITFFSNLTSHLTTPHPVIKIRSTLEISIILSTRDLERQFAFVHVVINI